MAPITLATVPKLLNAVGQLVNKGKTELTLNLSSPGGSAVAALAAYQYLKGRAVQLTTHNFGNVDSAAVILFCAGSKRFATPLSRFNLHRVSWQVQGKRTFGLEQISEAAKLVEQETDVMVKVISEVTGQPADLVNGWLRDRVVWNATQALDARLIHEVKSEIAETEPVASIGDGDGPVDNAVATGIVSPE